MITKDDEGKEDVGFFTALRFVQNPAYVYYTNTEKMMLLK